MKTYRLVLPIAACLAASVPASAQSFFDTSTPSQLINFGARIGVNSSNRTVSDDFYNLWNKNSWGTGFDLGVVADINIRQYLSVQPGIFFQSRSGDYTYCSRLWVPTVGTDGTITSEGQDLVQYGHGRTYNLYIPVVASVRFNLGSKVKWSVDVGPYVNFQLHSQGTPEVYKLKYAGIDGTPAYVEKHSAERNNVDFGFKLGTGFQFFSHYYIGVHYMAGATDVWKTEGMNGRNKAWTFTAGYDF